MNAKQTKQICRNEASVCALCGLTTCLCLGNCRFSHFFNSFLSFSVFQFHFHNQGENLWGPHGKLTCILGLRETCFHFHWTKSEKQFVAQCWRRYSCCNNDNNNNKLFNPILIYHLARGLRKLWHKIKKKLLQLERIFCIQLRPHRLHLSVGSPIERNAKSDNCSRYLV